MKTFQRFFIRIVDSIEGNQTLFYRYIYLFFAILFLRLTLEFFSSNRLFRLEDVLHIGLWFIFIVSAFLVQLKIYSGEQIIKVAKLVIVCFTIALTAPIIDLVLTGGVGAKMNYLSINTWNDVFWSYITIGGSSLTRGATPGIRIEIILLVLASINYVYAKRNNILLAIFSGISIYTVLFISGAIPAILGWLTTKFNLTYQHDDKSTLLLLLTLDLVLIATIASFVNEVKQKLNRKFFLQIEFICFPILFLIGVGTSLKLYPENWNLNPTTLFHFPLFLIMWLGYSFIRFLQASDISSGVESFRLRNAMLVILMLIQLLISEHLFFIGMLIWGLLFLLYESPLKLSQFKVGSILQGILFAAVTLSGFCAFRAPMVGFPKLILLVIIAFGVGLYLLADWLKSPSKQD